MADRRKFFTVGQIDATGVRGPHEKELEDISNAKYHNFIDLERESLLKILKEDIGGELVNIGFSEDWTITKEMFPEVNIHMVYTYIGDEFGGDIEAEFKFLFSGERVYWVPGEDIATYIDVVMDFIERQIKGVKPFEKNYKEKTELMKKVLEQRKEPFNLLKEEDKENLQDFIGANVWKNPSEWKFKKEIFPGIFIELIYDENQKDLDVSYSGDNLEKIGSYHIELIAIFLINHILRFITINHPEKDLPDICYIMFSRLMTKEKNWKHRRI
ncbi:MAG: hypothetical protein ACQERB_13740 [Promethearchaeati archaeon]